jgi:hypothetical protein
LEEPVNAKEISYLSLSVNNVQPVSICPLEGSDPSAPFFNLVLYTEFAVALVPPILPNTIVEVPCKPHVEDVFE